MFWSVSFLCLSYGLLLAVSNTQSRPTDSLVGLEALCSSKRAGVKWTAISPYYGGQINLDFSCTNSDGDIVLRNYQDQCFHKTGGLPLLAHIRERSMTHVISRDLESETTCTFTGHVLDRYEILLEIVTASCTIGDVSSSGNILPAVCESTGGRCQCSCNPSFEGRAHNRIDGNICEAVPATTMIATESTKVTSAIVKKEPTAQSPISTTQDNKDDHTTKQTQDNPTQMITDHDSSTLGTQINPTMVLCPVSTVTKTVTVTAISSTPITTPI